MFCRACLSFDDSMKYVSCNSYVDYFIEIARIDMKPSDDTHLCHVCAYKIRKSLKLRRQIIEADSHLQRISNRNGLTTDCSKVQELSSYPPLCVDIRQHTLRSGLAESVDDDPHAGTKFDVFIPVKRQNVEVNFSDDDVGEESPVADDASVPARTRKKRKQRSAARVRKRAADASAPRRTGVGRRYADRIRVIALTRDEQLAELRSSAQSESYRGSLFKCELCSHGFGFKETYDSHMQKHDKANGTLECDICHCVFRTRHSLDCHARYVHRLRYACTECGFTRATKVMVVEHYGAVHDSAADKKPFVCESCGDVFTKYSSLRRHSWKEHKSPGALQCPHCEKTLANSSSLRSHVNSVHSSVKPFECDVCGSRFATRTHLRTHGTKHSSYRNYYCVECDVAFKSETTFRKHLKLSIRHIDSDCFKQCAQCPLRFASESALDNHVYRAHLNVRRFACGACDKSFFSSSALCHHRARVHDGRLAEKKYTCETCGKAFLVKKTLRTHMNTHTGARPYKCALCEASFGHDASLYTHHRAVHLKIKKKPQARKGKRTASP